MGIDCDGRKFRKKENWSFVGWDDKKLDNRQQTEWEKIAET